MMMRRTLTVLLLVLGLVRVAGAVPLTLHHATNSISVGQIIDPDSVNVIFTDLRDQLNTLLVTAGVIEVYNGTGSPLVAGDLVYVNGYNAGSGNPTVALARANTDSTLAMLVIREAIAAAASGDASELYLLGSQNTASGNVGDVVYLSQASAGDWTLTAPDSLRQVVGRVETAHASTGRVVLQPGAFTLPRSIQTADIAQGAITNDKLSGVTWDSTNVAADNLAMSDVNGLEESEWNLLTESAVITLHSHAIDSTDVAADALAMSDVNGLEESEWNLLTGGANTTLHIHTSLDSSWVGADALAMSDVNGLEESEWNLLTDGGATTLHTHGAIDSSWVGADKLSMSDTNGLEEDEWNLLTDGGQTSLHTHAAATQDSSTISNRVRTIFLPLNSALAGGGSPAFAVQGGRNGWAFDATSIETVYFSAGVPGDAVAGANGALSIYWYVDGSPAASDTLVWVADHGILAGPNSTAAMTTDFGGSNVEVAGLMGETLKFTTLQTGISVAPDDWIQVAIRRVATDASDTWASDAQVVAVRLQYTADM